jgi:hypothetical protein
MYLGKSVMRVEGDDGLAIGLQNINCSVIRG